MLGIHKVILLGRLSKEPKKIQTKSEVQMVAFDVLTRSYDRQSRESKYKSMFHEVICFGSRAEFVINYLSKGDPVYVEGSLQDSEYVKQDGSKVYNKKIIASIVEGIRDKKAPVESKAETQRTDMIGHTLDLEEDEIPF